MSASCAGLEQRYRRLLRLYPREFRARHADEMIGVLMASAADGQGMPARGDVSDIVRGSLLARLRGPRGGWPFALSAFALVAPLFLVLADALQVAFPAPVRNQPAFMILVAGHLVVAAAALAGLRRTALAALVIAAAADYTQWSAFHVLDPRAGAIAFLTIAVFPLEAIALAAADPRAARRREGWQHVFPVLALAVAAQLLALPSGNAIVATGCVLALLAVLLPLPLGLGWRASLLLAAACYPLVMLVAGLRPSPGHPLPRALGTGPVPAPVAHAIIVAILYLPPLLVLAAGATWRPRRR